MKNTYTYPVVICEDKECECFVVEIPGFFQHTHGDTMEEAVENAKVALDMIICDFLNRGKELPSPDECQKSVKEEQTPYIVPITVTADPDAYVKVLWISTKCIPCCVGLLDENDTRGVTVNYAIPSIDYIIDGIVDNADIVALPYDASEVIKQKLIEMAGDKPVFQEVVNSENDTDDIFGGFLRWEKLN